MEGGWWEGVDDLDNGLTMEEVVGTRFWLKEDGIEGVDGCVDENTPMCD